MNYDLAIIGGGPAGYTAAERAGAAGLSTVLFERNVLGGVCLNEGCIPTKTLLYSAKVLDTIHAAPKYGIEAKDASFDLPRIIARKNKVVKKLVAAIRIKMGACGVTTVSGDAVIEGRDNNGCLLIGCKGDIYRATNLILCTGSDTFIPPIPGLDGSGYWTSREALQSKDLPSSLVIIGGGVIGMEFASFFNSLGADVSVVEMMDDILPGMDREVSAMLREAYTKRGVRFHTGHKVTGVAHGAVTVEKDGDTFVIVGEKILVSVGRRPNTCGLGLDKLGIETDGRGVKTNQYMQTVSPNVYACGDITGFSMLAHTAVSEAETAVSHITGSACRGISYKAIPSVVYTNPEIAGVGATEEELQALGVAYTVKKIPMTFSGRFVAENEMGSGLCKLILSSPGETVIGAHIIGNPSSELIAIAGIAVEKGFDAKELSSFVFPHPTVGEILKEASL
ncbi:MAG: dihydrolipoyl dehydrogenase [Tannerellaceae bacterium]|jgi:dihydrolipoamide dehydrogenase|nr:dihydrolipoyl dehydrogenase [Tannerellaceae bacterium]